MRTPPQWAGVRPAGPLATKAPRIANDGLALPLIAVGTVKTGLLSLQCVMVRTAKFSPPNPFATRTPL